MKRWSALPPAILAALMLFIGSVRADMIDYTFVEDEGKITDMSGGQTLLKAGADEEISAVTDIGFTFYFDGLAYTQFSVDANGLMQLGGTPLNSQYWYGDMYYYYYAQYYLMNYGDTFGYPDQNGPLLTAFEDDMVTYGDGVRYKVTGASGQRVLTIEWQSQTIYAYYNSGVSFQYQIRLYEGSNRIEFVYGDMGTDDYNYYGYIGMCENAYTDLLSIYTYGQYNSYTDYYNWQYNAPYYNRAPFEGQLFRFSGCEQQVIGDESQGWPTAEQVDTLFLSMPATEIAQNSYYYPFSLSANESRLCVPTDITYRLSGTSASEYAVYGPSSMNPGEYQTVEIDFAPTGPGRRYATLEMVGGSYSRTLVLAAEASPRLEWIPDLAQGGTPSLRDHDTLLRNQFVEVGMSQPIDPMLLRWMEGGSSEGNFPATITYSLSGTNPEYSLSSSDATLYSPGDEHPIEIIFSPMHVGRSVDTLTVTADGDKRVFILYAFGSGRGGSMTAMVDGVVTRLDSNVQLFRMEYSCAGELLSMPITVTNTGTLPFAIHSIDIYNTDTVVRQGQPRYPLLPGLVPSSDYKFTEFPATMPLGNNPSIEFPYTLQVGETRTWYLTFAPGRAGMRFARAFVHTDAQLVFGRDPNGERVEGLYDFDLFGRGTSSSLTDNLNGGTMKPVIFPPTPLGTSVREWVKVANTGTCDLHIDSAALRIVSGDVNDFRIVSQPLSWSNSDGGQAIVPVGGIDSFQVEFTPRYGGSRRASILFRTNDSMLISPDNVRGEWYLDLYGVGGSGLYGSNISIDAGEIGNATGPWSQGKVTLTNASAGPATITNIFWEGADSVDFMAIGWPTLPTVIPPSGMNGLTVEFHPMAGVPGLRQAVLAVVTSTGDTVRSTVSAMAGLRSLMANPTAVNFPVVKSGRVVRQTVVLQNTGTLPVTILGVSISGVDMADFHVAPLPRTELAPGQSELIEVSYSRATAGTSVGSLDITSNVAPIQVPLNATATVNRYTGGDDPDGSNLGDGGKDLPGDNGAEFGVAGVAAEQVVSALTVLPNPVVGSDLEVNYRAVRGGAVRIEMVNASGVVVNSVERNGVVAGVDQRERLNVAGLGSGVYLLRVVTAEGVAVRSVVLTR